MYFIDEINTAPVEFPAAYIINSESRRYPDGRWLAVFINTQSVTFYFDVFGRQPHLPDIIEFFYICAINYVYFTTPLTSNPLGSVRTLLHLLFVTNRTIGLDRETRNQ